jgi:predicted O-linked N-acetylglucosamine transferase (SPINDLY family)
LIGLSQVDDAILEFNAALNLNPKYWQAWTMSGFAFQLRGQLAVALEHCQRAIQLAPEVAEPHHRLGVVLREADRLQDGIAEFQKALALKPKYPEALSDLAGAYDRLGDIDAAIHAYRRAIDVDPRHPIAHCGLGIALAGLGRIEEAMVAISKAFEVKPDYEAARSAYLFLLNYSPKHDPQAIFEEHRKWARARAESLSADARPFENDRTPNRRLRIGYVSPDFKQHSVAFFLTPVLANHDHSAFEVYCYSDVRNPDPATHQLRGYADCWRDIAGLSDKQVANLVRSDHIDVLIDLAVHSGNNRLLAFARRAAPVQATWLGYAGTTGLSTMDYKITDRYLDPVGTAEGCHSEQLIRLPDCYFCYTPPPGYPEVSPLPALRRGFVTFAAFQNLAKVSLKAIELWAGLLRQVAGSQLALKGRGLGSNATRQRLIAAFADCGIGSERLRFGHWGTMVEYLQGFSDVDIALDTTPFTGGTTTCHALWMGIPVVTLAGSSAVGRVGASILHTLSLPSLIARTPEEFAQVGARLAQDLASLAALRAGLRSRMKRSPLMDAERFTRNIEATFTAMWQSWCRGRIQNPSGS